jgi:hypothetical protein
VVAVRSEDGTVIVEGFITATEGGPGRGTWEWTIELATPGVYVIEASESDPSGGEGRPPFTAARTVRVVG